MSRHKDDERYDNAMLEIEGNIARLDELNAGGYDAMDYRALVRLSFLLSRVALEQWRRRGGDNNGEGDESGD